MKKIVTVILILLASVIFVSDNLSFAQGQTCPSHLSKAECNRLNDELQALEKEIAEWQKVLDETKAKKNTLQGDVTLLNAQISKAETEIKQRGISITTLNSEINQRSSNISVLENKIANNKRLLAQLLQKKYENEVEPIFYLLLSAEDISNLVTDLDSIDTVNQGLQELSAELMNTKTEVEQEKAGLAIKKDKELDAKYEVELKKKAIAKSEAEKKELLALTAKTESNYQIVLSDRQRKAETIRSALFELRDAGGMSFAQALGYANTASEKTGVRPALILAILEQESDLGKHLGSCTIYDLASGKSQGVNTGRIFNQGIHPTRDLPLLQTILKELGRNPINTRISCPLITELAGGQYKETGYGGAMGPSQFIPSTWQLYIPRLKQIFGVQPDPWNPEHAITATALLMKDNGASAGGYTAERTAALKYYAGGNWSKPANAFYGNQVIAKAEKHQANIDFLSGL